MTEYVIELGLIHAIPNMCTTNMKPGRLKGIYKRIQALTIKEIYRQPAVGMSKGIMIGERLLKFAKRMDWEKREVAIEVLLSFVLGLIEDSQYRFSKKLVDNINDAVDFVTHGVIEDEHTAEAEEALKVWRELKA